MLEVLMLEDIINSSKEKLNYIYKKFKYLPYFALISFMLASGCTQKGPVGPSNKPNKPPKTKIIRPINNQVFNTDQVAMEWTGTDEDGKVDNYEINLSGYNMFTTRNTSETYKVGPGVNELIVKAIDNSGAKDLAGDRVNFTVRLENISPVDNTNANGYVKLEIGSAVFDVNVKNESNQPLNNIKVSGEQYQNNIYGFLAEDFSRTYLSEMKYYGGGFGKFDISANPNTNISIFMRAKERNGIRKEKLLNYRLKSGKLQLIGITTLSGLHEFYKKYDSLFRGKSDLEFMVNITESGTIMNDSFTFALQAENFREEIINNASNVASIINTVASYFGQGYDADAYYFDVYIHKDVGVVTHVPNENNYCTLKGKVTNINYQPINNANVTLGSGVATAYTNTNGDYIIKFLLPSGYSAKATAANYQPQTKYINIVAPTPPYYTSTYLNFQLPQISGGQEATIIFQPKSEGIDAYVAKDLVYNQPDPNNYGNSPSLFAWYHPNVVQMRSFIKFDLSTMPQFSQINSAILSIRGLSWHIYDPNLNSATVAIKKVTSSWSEQTINWNSQPGIGETIITKQTNSEGWHDFIITSLTDKWLRGTENNYGLAIMLYQESGNQQCTFHSSDISGYTQPKLTIKYVR